MSFLKEFRDFAVRGNVIDLAVGVIIGAGFGKIVDSVVKDLINPLVGVFVGKPDFTNMFLVLKAPENYTGPATYEALTKAGATVFGYGAFLTALVQFILLAFAIFWLVKFVSAAQRKVVREAQAEAPAAPAEPPEDVVLLREIRDSLRGVSR
ncbi:large conductance mechanosensitive channel protein MscL [Derxia lacustris]|uniref:large conductance mechanosensitive channel protein MscL n=1 Tax=Derxia lacustris TaxID=764842 RepID=UPI000A177616|nr:large conductance mechanosensitive channel protein MscL [Derxia lacustris]